MNPNHDKKVTMAFPDEDGPITAGYVPVPGSTPRPRTDSFSSATWPEPLTEVIQLCRPRWAKVAFLARCARRVLPLYHHYTHGVKQTDIQNLVTLVNIAERSAATAGLLLAEELPAGITSLTIDLEESRRLRSWVIDQDASLHPRRSRFHGREDDTSALGFVGREDVVCVVADAAVIALYATEGSILDYNPDAIVRIREVLTKTYRLLVSVAALGIVWNLSTPTRDLRKLVKLATEGQWTDDTPVPPEVFGPMWEGSPPSWWRDDVLADLPPEANQAPEQPTGAATS